MMVEIDTTIVVAISEETTSALTGGTIATQATVEVVVRHITETVSGVAEATAQAIVAMAECTAMT